MSLGNNGLAGFKPHRSGTAATLLTTVPPTRNQIKTERLELRISSDALQMFKEICAANDTNVSEAIRNYISDVVTCGNLKF